MIIYMPMAIFCKEYSFAYDFLYGDKDYEKECNFIESVFRKYSNKVKKILDLGCGTGGHALILADRGYTVAGVDIAKEMLETAKSKAKKSDLAIKFFKKDITSFDLKDKFDAAISMFSVMGYQTTNQAFLKACKTARKHLSPGGIFLFDCWNGNSVLTQKPRRRTKEVIINPQEKIVRIGEPVIDTLTHTVELRFKVIRMRSDSIISETNELHRVRFFFPQEVRFFLEIAGFKHTEIHPFLKLQRSLTDDDWNMAVVAKTR